MLLVVFLIWWVQTHTHPYRHTDWHTEWHLAITESAQASQSTQKVSFECELYKHVHVMLYALWTFTVLNFSSLIIGKGATDQVRSRSDYVASWRGVAVLAAGALPETDWGLRRCQWLQASVYKCRKYDLFLISLFST